MPCSRCRSSGALAVSCTFYDRSGSSRCTTFRSFIGKFTIEKEAPDKIRLMADTPREIEERITRSPNSNPVNVPCTGIIVGSDDPFWDPVHQLSSVVHIREHWTGLCPIRCFEEFISTEKRKILVLIIIILCGLRWRVLLIRHNLDCW